MSAGYLRWEGGAFDVRLRGDAEGEWTLRFQMLRDGEAFGAPTEAVAIVVAAEDEARVLETGEVPAAAATPCGRATRATLSSGASTPVNSARAARRCPGARSPGVTR